MFVAIPGTRADGGRYIADAAARVERLRPSPPRQPYCRRPEYSGPTRLRSAPHAVAAASRLYAGQPQTVVAVTGTSGKTSVAEFTRQIFARLGHEAASLGTIGVVSPKSTVYGSLTTPEPVTLHKTLAALAADGTTHLAMEASVTRPRSASPRRRPHRRRRLTNLGRDHLDYHPTVEDYFAAKCGSSKICCRAASPPSSIATGTYAAEAEAIARDTGRPVLTVGRGVKR